MDKVDFPLVDVIRLKPLDRYRLWLRFTDGREGVVDLSDDVTKGGPMLQPLKDPAFFACVFIGSGVPTWPNGYDMDAINLFMNLRDAGLLTSGAASAAE